MLKKVLTDIRFYLFLLAIVVFGAIFLVILNDWIMPSYTKYDEGQTVPDVRGTSITQARELLVSDGLRDTVIDRRYNAAYPPDYVIDQNPSANQIVKPDRKIYLTINTSSVPKVIVPDVENMSLRNAELQLKNYGLDMGQVSYVSSPFKNTVIRQSIDGGTPVDRGTVISLTVSDGLGINMVKVPELLGLRLSEAQSHIRDVGLHTGTISYQPSSTVEPNHVLGFNPSGKDSLREGSTIDLIISEPAKTQEVRESAPVIIDSTQHDSLQIHDNKDNNKP